MISRKKLKKPPFEGLYPYLVFIFLGFCVADLAMIPLRGMMLPTQVPPARRHRASPDDFSSRGNFSSVTSRNIFSQDGTIPPALAAKDQGEEEKKDAAPVPSSLPLNLIGTIVHSNPEKSVANIEVKTKTIVIAARPGKDIEGLATLISVERGKVIIRNSNNQRLEFIELKNLSKLTFNAAAKTTTAAAGKEEVQMVAPNKYEIKRADLLKYTADMGSVLQQAAMQPVRGANGAIEGFKFMNIQPGSIYSQLGFQVGDVIKGVNGEPVDSPAKAMEMYNALKNNPSIKIRRGRDGKDEEVDYTIK